MPEPSASILGGDGGQPVGDGRFKTFLGARFGFA